MNSSSGGSIAIIRAASLLLAKPLGDVPHKGGMRFGRGSLLHQLPARLDQRRRPSRRRRSRQAQVRSTFILARSSFARPCNSNFSSLAHYSDGSDRDVTRLGIYTANTERVASVDEDGLVTTRELGETAVVARFERIFATANFIVLEPDPASSRRPCPPNNLIDRHVIASSTI